MANSYDLTHLDPNTFQHMVNALALRVLGSGTTGFGPGADGGRDGYFEGEAPYPSSVEHWSGRWYIQSKYHAPNLSSDAQKWLINEIKSELAAFQDSKRKRLWPDNWIVATNVVPSAVPESGTFDLSKELVGNANDALRVRFHIWGGDKILDLLNEHQDIARRYGHFLTPGHVLTRFMEAFEDEKASANAIISHLVVSAIEEQQHTKLEQAGSEEDKRPGIHQLFVDLPFAAKDYQLTGSAAMFLAIATAQSHRLDHHASQSQNWFKWRRHPARASVWFLKGGPGQGKSTIGQFFCQIQRAALILEPGGSFRTTYPTRALAIQIRETAQKKGLWPTTARIPIYIELKQYAQWYGERNKDEAKGVFSYLSSRIGKEVQQPVMVGTLRRALTTHSWFVAFDGLDEVPSDIKDEIAREVHSFLREAATSADLFTLCTSRPQGYSGQFSTIDGPEVALSPLDATQAMQCAALLLHFDRPRIEADAACSVLENAIKSPAVKELMTTPLQSHIMAIIVRSGQHPPEKKWELYRRFYEVIRIREANRSPEDRKLAILLAKDKELLKDVHNRLGFILHAHAETVKGAQSSLPKDEFRRVVERIVGAKKDGDIAEVVETIMTAATDRLVLITTPDDGRFVRFQIRQLQEFFAAEFLCDGVSPDELRSRMTVIAGDPHWEEVMHFLLSALVSSNRRTDLSVASSVLQSLDDGSENSADRTLYRRMARGAIMVGRLMEDGVLESDKGLRNLFRERLGPLVASKDLAALRPLMNTNGPASKAWLREFLFRCLSESVPMESMGAAIILFCTLRDNETIDIERFRSHWLHFAPYEKEFIFGSLMGGPGQSSMWSMKWFAEFLADDAAIKHASLVLRDLFIYPDNEDFRRKLHSVVGLTIGSEAAQIIDLYWSLGDSNKAKYEKYGIVTIHLKDLSTPSSQLMAIVDATSLLKFSGIIELIRCAARYACRRSPAEFTDLLTKLDDSWQTLELLPDCIRDCLPDMTSLGTPNALLQSVRLASSIEELSILLACASCSTLPHRIEINHIQAGNPDDAKEGLRRLIKEYPDTGMQIWSYRSEITADNSLDDLKTTELVLEETVKKPRYVERMSVRDWSQLVLQKNPQAALLRASLPACFHQSKLKFLGFFGYRDQWKGFPAYRFFPQRPRICMLGHAKASE